jgi:hypothetical protein
MEMDWAHTLRKYQNNTKRQGLDWNPQGERRKGRPRIIWKRTILTELQEQNVSWKEAKQRAKNSLLTKICYGPMFHLGITGNDDDVLTKNKGTSSDGHVGVLTL